MPREIPTGRKKEEDRGLITEPTLPFIGREEKEEPQKETQELPVSYGGEGVCRWEQPKPRTGRYL